MRCHRMDIRVRPAEADQLGRLHPRWMAVYMEMGRTEMLREAGMTYRDLESEGVLIVVTRLRIRFHEAARCDDLLALETSLTRATTARIDHHYELLRGDSVLAEGATTLACLGRDGAVQRMPQRLLSLLDVV